MYNHILKADDSYLAKAQAVPQNATADGNGGAFDLSGAMGGVEIVAQINEDVGLADTKFFTVKLQHSDDGSSYSDLATLYTVTASGATTISAETILGRFLPANDCKPYIKAVLVTDDPAASGKVDVFVALLPR